MANDYFSLRDRPSVPSPNRDSGTDVQYLLRAEEQLLHSIFARIPLAEILRKICNALNSEMGNMVSLVSLSSDDANFPASIVKNAAIFGLHKFCSATVVGGNDEVLGSIEMYGCVPRRPLLGEVRLIERATCLAAIAIRRHNEIANGGGRCDSYIPLVRRESASNSVV
jgi:hypothetical protein